MDTTVFRPASYVHSAIDHLALALAIGGALVLLALAAFLLRWRTVLVAAVAIPLSLVAAALVLDLTEATINLLVIAGLAVAIGVWSTTRPATSRTSSAGWKAGPGRGDGAPTAGAILAASLGRRRSMGFATLVVLLAAAPVLFLGGLDGAFLHPMALAFVLAVLASMLVALTVTPALSLLVMSRPPRAPRDPVLGRALRRRHDGVVGRFAASPQAALVLTVGALLVVGARRARADRHVAAPLLQGPRAARALGRDAEHVAARDGPHHRRAPPSCGPSRGSATSGPTSAAPSPATRPSAPARARCGSRWTLGGLRRDARPRSATSSAATRACAAAS